MKCEVVAALKNLEPPKTPNPKTFVNSISDLFSQFSTPHFGMWFTNLLSVEGVLFLPLCEASHFLKQLIIQTVKMLVFKINSMSLTKQNVFKCESLDIIPTWRAFPVGFRCEQLLF